MKKPIAITIKIIITLLLIAPPALLALENICRRPIKNPKQKLVRAWDVEDNTHDGTMRFRFNINKDGTVEGTVEGAVANAVMQDAYLKRNRHWFSKLLGQRRDYKVEGRLETSPVEEPREGFWLEFNLDKKGEMTNVKAGL
jgi:hypothetical protein